MNIKHETTYTDAEVKQAIMAMHIATFGAAPAGMRWEHIERYGEPIIMAVEVKGETKKEEVDAI